LKLTTVWIPQIIHFLRSWHTKSKKKTEVRKRCKTLSKISIFGFILLTFFVFFYIFRISHYSTLVIAWYQLKWLILMQNFNFLNLRIGDSSMFIILWVYCVENNKKLILLNEPKWRQKNYHSKSGANTCIHVLKRLFSKRLNETAKKKKQLFWDSNFSFGFFVFIFFLFVLGSEALKTYVFS
jgi:hypothetical protein